MCVCTPFIAAGHELEVVDAQYQIWYNKYKNGIIIIIINSAAWHEIAVVKKKIKKMYKK
jgi:hypothetical protein